MKTGVIYLQLKKNLNYVVAEWREKEGGSKEHMDITITIKEFKKHMKAAGYADSTVKAYSYWLCEFEKYLEKCGIDDLRKVTRREILNYREKVMSEPASSETRALKLRPVKQMFEYLEQSHRILISPAEGLPEVRGTKKRIKTVLTSDEIKNLFSQAGTASDTSVRNRAVMELMYSTGIRVMELEHLEVHDPDFDSNVIHIHRGKGSRERIVPLGKSVARHLKKYLQEVRPGFAQEKSDEKRLFLSNTGTPLTANNIRGFMRRYRIKAGIAKPASPHTFRRTCATHMLQQGADIRHIQELLGHKSLKTTQQYTKIIPVDVKKTHEKTHPGKKLKPEKQTDEKKNENKDN